MSAAAKDPFARPEWDARNSQHRLEPKVGDFWQEMFVPIMVVIAVKPKTVTVCKTTKDAGDNCWTWDLDHFEVMSREDFAAYPLYQSPSMNDRCWCDVMPEAHKWVRKAAIEALFGAST